MVPAVPLAVQYGQRIIGWGTGQSAAAVQQTLRVAQSLTPDVVRRMVEQGLSKGWVLEQLALYERSAQVGHKVVHNAQLLPRLELMRRLIELWPAD